MLKVFEKSGLELRACVMDTCFFYSQYDLTSFQIYASYFESTRVMIFYTLQPDSVLAFLTFLYHMKQEK